MENNQICKLKCHFGTTYKAGMIGDLPFLFKISKGDLTMKAYGRFDEILTVGYFLNGLSILDLKFANLLYERHNW